MARPTPRKLTPTYIKAWRKHRRLTQMQLAGEIGIDHSTLSRLERGEIPYTQERLEKIATVLGCRPADLLDHPPGAASERNLWTEVERLPDERKADVVRVVRAIIGR